MDSVWSNLFVYDIWTWVIFIWFLYCWVTYDKRWNSGIICWQWIKKIYIINNNNIYIMYIFFFLDSSTFFYRVAMWIRDSRNLELAIVFKYTYISKCWDYVYVVLTSYPERGRLMRCLFDWIYWMLIWFDYIFLLNRMASGRVDAWRWKKSKHWVNGLVQLQRSRCGAVDEGDLACGFMAVERKMAAPTSAYC